MALSKLGIKAIGIFVTLAVLVLIHQFALPTRYTQHAREFFRNGARLENTDPTVPVASTAIPSSAPLASSGAHAANDGLRKDFCTTAPEESRNIMVVFKTGAAVLENRIPAHLLTITNCIPPENLLIFSDVEQNFAGHRIHDALKYVTKETKDRNADFRVYDELQDLHSAGVDFGKMKGKKSWDLDKWKFLPVLHAAHAAAPDHIDWFIILEGDSSVSWLNTLLFLKRFDPKKAHYLGSPNFIGSTLFAHGGSGTILSRAAVDKLEQKRADEGREAYDRRWDNITGTNWAGDCVLSQALTEVDIRLTASWPVVQGESVASQDYTRKHWCSPPATMHHVRAAEISQMWDFEGAWVRKHGWSKPYLWRDLFVELLLDKVSVNRTSWNNMSKQRKIIASYSATAEEVVSPGFLKWDSLNPVEQAGVENADNCARTCAEMEGDIANGDACLQWVFKPGRCYLGSVPQFGEYDDSEGIGWTSGWMQDRLAAEIEARNPCPEVWNRPG